MRYFFTSDFHLGHFNIIKYCGRPFKTLEEHDETIITNHNNRVKEDDIVFYIGDFCFKNSAGGKKGEGVPIKAKEYLAKLKGKFIFIQGNHDRNNSLKTPITKCHIRLAGKTFNLVHNPEYVDMDVPINIVGHIHQNWTIKRIKKGEKFTDAINVGVDVNGFKPITFEEVMSKYHKWLKSEKYK